MELEFDLNSLCIGSERTNFTPCVQLGCDTSHAAMLVFSDGCHPLLHTILLTDVKLSLSVMAVAPC